MGVANPDNMLAALEGKIPTEDNLKQFLQKAGVPVKKTKPFGNDPCPCGSGSRYDMCCSERKLL
jgi:uncharacterized protein YecA (UPF0149 family)